MAYIYPDYMPTSSLLTDEEERRRRLEEEAAAATPVTQTIKTNPVTGEQEMTIKGTPQDLSAANPLTPTVLPVAPQAIAPQPVEMPQPMAMPQPGPGVQVASVAPTLPQTQAPAPAQEIPTIDQLAEQERQKALAAQAAQAQQPTAPAAPVAPVSPEQVAPSIGQPPTPGPGVQVAGPAQMPPAAPAPTFHTRFSEAASDVSRLDEMRKDESLTKEQRMLAARQQQKLLEQEYGRYKGEQEVAAMNDSQIGRVLSKKSDEGSWAKMILLGFISPDLAGKEAAKLGLNDKWVTGTNERGEPIVYKTRDGVPIEGYNANTDKRLSAKELIGAAGTQLGNRVTTTAETYVDSEGNRYRSQTDEKGNSRLVNIATGTRFTGDATKLQRQTDVSSMARVDYGLATDLLKKHSGNVLDMMKEYETIKGPMTPEGRAEFMQRYGYGTTVQVPGAAPAAPAAPAATMTPDQRAQATRLDGDIAALQREIKATKPTETGRLQILNSELQRATQQRQQLGGAIGGLPGGPVGATGAPAGASISKLKQQEELGTAAEKERIQVAGKRSESFNKHIDDTITPDSINGDKIAQTRKEQFTLFNRPGVDAGKIFGIANGAGSTPGDQRWTMFRDILLGKVSEPADRIRERAAALGLNREEQSAVAEYAIKNAEINALTLKSTAGPGSVSEAEQKLNQERNVDPTKVPMLGGYNAMAQSQFNGDLARYKGDWTTSSKATNTAELEKDWRKEKAKISQLYTDMARQRIEYISSMGNTPAAIKEGYRRFPVPEYDPATETWKKTRPIGSYAR